MFFETIVIFSATSIHSLVNYIIFDFFYNQDESLIRIKEKERIENINKLKLKRLKENDDLMKLLDDDYF